MLFNTGKINNTGIEIALNADIAKNLSAMAAYSYINMEKPVYATPEHQLFVSGHYRLNKLHIMANVQYVNGLDTDPSNSVNTHENCTILNAKISYRIWKSIKLFTSAENLLDLNYEINRYYTMPGITFFGGLNLKF
jgi:iron complex outermembrane receptor protein